MPYVTVKQSVKYYQVSFEDMLEGVDNWTDYIQFPESSATITRYVKQIRPIVLEHLDVDGMIAALRSFNQLHASLHRKNKRYLYHTFPLPKKTGGFRNIDAPCEQLKEAQRQLCFLLKNRIFSLHHNAAFAYINKRDTYRAVLRHQQNKSNWFFKSDFSNFFGSTTPKFAISMLKRIFPFSEICAQPEGYKELTQALDLCFLDGKLPQGTPISPYLTNVFMIPIDHAISSGLRKFGEPNMRFVYTRYADDIFISARRKFQPEEMQKFIEQILKQFQAPYLIKPDKVDFCSKSGHNFMLGVVLNKDHNITIGHKNNRRFRAAVHSYMADRQAGKPWDKEDVQRLQGQINYYRRIESEYVNHVISSYSEKFKTNVVSCLRQDAKLAF